MVSGLIKWHLLSTYPDALPWFLSPPAPRTVVPSIPSLSSSVLLQTHPFSLPSSQVIIWFCPSPRKWKLADRYSFISSFPCCHIHGCPFLWPQARFLGADLPSTIKGQFHTLPISHLPAPALWLPPSIFPVPPLPQSAHSPAVRIFHRKKKNWLSAL